MASRCVEDVEGFAAAVAEGGAVERGRIRDEMETGSVVYEKGHRLTLKSSRYGDNPHTPSPSIFHQVIHPHVSSIC